MKKFLAGLVVLFILMVSVPLAADAQCSCRRRNYSSRRYSNRNVSRYNYNRNVNRYGYKNANYRTYSTQSYVYKRPTFYQRHRNLINLGIGTGGGALIGALVGGRRGALLGTGIGAGSSALYTYVLNPKKRRYYRR
ncbi:MAG: glycine zipper family protein [Pyrinomonadaceae bacterium]